MEANSGRRGLAFALPNVSIVYVSPWITTGASYWNSCDLLEGICCFHSYEVCLCIIWFHVITISHVRNITAGWVHTIDSFRLGHEHSSFCISLSSWRYLKEFKNMYWTKCFIPYYDLPWINGRWCIQKRLHQQSCTIHIISRWTTYILAKILL